MYGLVDCNNFYALFERVFNPALSKKPIVVLNNNDGCVIARSNEAKAVGIPMGAPAFEFEELFAKHDVKVFSANFELKSYGEQISRNIKKATGIPVSVGFAPTKALAKVAYKIAKKCPVETNGIYLMLPRKVKKGLKMA